MVVTTQKTQTVYQAMHELAIRCDGARGIDGAGFNKWDSPLGKQLAATPPDRWSPKQLWAGYLLARKYQHQLIDYGVDFNSIPKPVDPSTIKLIATAPGRCSNCQGTIETGSEFRWGAERGSRLHIECSKVKAKPKLRRLIARDQDGRFALTIEWFDPDRERIADDIRALDGRLWDKQRKVWLVRPSEPNLAFLLNLIEARGFEISSEDLSALTEEQRKYVALRERSEAKSSTGRIDALIDALVPPGYSLFPFQRAGVEYAYDAKRVLIGDQPGLGKTRQYLATVLLHGALPSLIVCPSSVKYNWKREIRMIKPDASVFVAEGLQCEIPRDVDFVVTNYDILASGTREVTKRHYAPIFTVTGQNLANVGFKSIGLDEVHLVKNGETNRGAACLALAESCDIRIGLSGTPIENRPKELIHQLKVIGRFKELFRTDYKFLTRYTNAEHNGFGMDFSGAAPPSRLVELNRILRANCFIRRLKADVWQEMPEKLWVTLPVEFTHRNEMAALLREMREARRRGQPLVGYFARMRQITGAGKAQAVGTFTETLLSGGVEKLVVFAYHHEVQDHLIDVIGKVLTRLGKEDKATYTLTKIFAEDSAKKRDEATQRFQHDRHTRVIVCSWAAREGITLTEAHHLVFAEQDWTPSKMEQASDRVHRFGATKDVTIYNCVAEGTLDERIGDLLDQKIRIIRAAQDGKLDGDVRNKIEVDTMAEILAMIEEEVES